jgi:large subunit ribosomal protein L22
MAQQTVKLNYLKISPRKVRLIADAIKGLPVQEAEAQLLMRPQRSAPALLKLLRSAVANAKSRDMKIDSLYVSSIRVDKGPIVEADVTASYGSSYFTTEKDESCYSSSR